MRRSRTPHGFTLIEVLTVIVIILILAGMILYAYGPGQKQAAKTKATSQIHVMAMAAENFKADYGSYPRGEYTEPQVSTTASPIDPRVDGNPNTAAYKNSSAFLYTALSGDEDKDGRLTPPDEKSKGYMNFDRNMLGGAKDANGNMTSITHILDPFGYPYGYSTAGAKQEEDFIASVKTLGAKAKRADKPQGFNPTFDLWSTANKVITSTPTDIDRNGWAKNW